MSIWWVVTWGGCGFTAPEPVAAPVPVPAEAPAGKAKAKGDGPSAPTPALVRRLAEGKLPRGKVVDPQQGVVFTSVGSDARGDDPRADEHGVVREAVLACGDDLASRYDALTEDVRGRLGEGLAVDCEGMVCRFPARMEYDRGGKLTFRKEGGGLVLVAVERIEGGPVSADFTREAEAWSGEQVAALSAEGCP
ncbi:MAG: hypothetical protein R3F59_36915 [Myxococcota bacterium]